MKNLICTGCGFEIEPTDNGLTVLDGKKRIYAHNELECLKQAVEAESLNSYLEDQDEYKRDSAIDAQMAEDLERSIKCAKGINDLLQDCLPEVFGRRETV